MAGLEVCGAEVRRGEARMRFDLRIPEGCCTALVGPSGAGKSTLVGLIAGFDALERGSIRFRRKDMARLTANRRPAATLFQDHNLFPHLDAFRNVGLGIHPGLRLGAKDRARVLEALARVGLNGLERRLPRELSGGEQQRAALARVLVQARPLWLLDEPFAALGPALRRSMLALVDEIRRERGVTMAIVTHAPDDARRIAERTAFVHAGRVLAEGPTAELLNRRDAPELTDYLGE